MSPASRVCSALSRLTTTITADVSMPASIAYHTPLSAGGRLVLQRANSHGCPVTKS
jgi:hypothetical protein